MPHTPHRGVRLLAFALRPESAILSGSMPSPASTQRPLLRTLALAALLASNAGLCLRAVVAPTADLPSSSSVAPHDVLHPAEAKALPAPSPTATSFSASPAPPASLPALVVSAARLPGSAAQVPFSVDTLDARALRESPALTLDGALRALPGFSLFRRTDSLVANPSAQGVSLRGLGPSGASRSLVLLDGLPLTDPFGGWVAWSKLPRETLERAEVARGGGATAWGNAALGGIVHLTSAPVSESASVRLAALGGAHRTGSFEWLANQPLGARADASATTAQFSGRVFSSEGYTPMAPEFRGPVDRPASSRHQWFSGRLRHVLPGGAAAQLTLRSFTEDRNNGTRLQTNASRERLAALHVDSAAGGDFVWSSSVYAQEQDFRSTFSSIAPGRASETPASDQHAVPATAWGASWTGTWRATEAATTAGFDVRSVRGETREYTTWDGRAFTRERNAGGAQLVAGAFLLRQQPLAPSLLASAGLRLDAWREVDGHRRDAERASGAVLRDDRFASRSDTEPGPSLGLVWTPDASWRLRAAAQRAFRRPTLNELYRPFRVGNTLTEPDPGLRTESVRSVEASVEWRPRSANPHAPASAGDTLPGRPRSTTSLSIEATAFAHDLRDLVANVTQVRGPGLYPIFGYIPAGGAGRLKRNLPRASVSGAELSLRWSPAPAWSLSVEVLALSSEVRRAPAEAPGLAGLRLAQVPRVAGTLSLSASPAPGWFVGPRLRYAGSQFEDDENRLPLRAAWIADLALSRHLGTGIEAFAALENIGGARIETGRSADGTTTLGTPRWWSAGLRASF